jgi:hypothetical protein
MERIRQEFNLTDKLEAVAEFYGYSLRRFYDRVAQGKVLGVTHVPGYGVIFWSDGPYEIAGPFPGGANNNPRAAGHCWRCSLLFRANERVPACY